MMKNYCVRSTRIIYHELKRDEKKYGKSISADLAYRSRLRSIEEARRDFLTCGFCDERLIFDDGGSFCSVWSVSCSKDEDVCV